MITQVTHRLVLITFVLLFAGCTTPYKPPKLDPDDIGFHGAHPTSRGVTESKLIMIHGMCHHDIAWVRNSRDRLAKSFQMQAGPLEPIGEQVNNVRAYKTILKDENSSITLYGIVYGDATKQIKKVLCKDVSQPTQVCPGEYDRKRASLNAFFKNVLLNDCLADAVIYLSNEGEAIRIGVKNSLAAIYDDGKNSQIPTVFLSESLGSKVLRDALLCRPDEKARKGLSLVAESDTIFLGANQIPLLNLGNGAQCDGDILLDKRFLEYGFEATGGFEDVLKVIQNTEKLEVTLLEKIIAKKNYQVISFTDPNDLLSYEIDPEEYGDNQVVNVIVSNDKTWFGSLENPYTSHTGYRENDDVIELLKCGWKKGQSDKCREE